MGCIKLWVIFSFVANSSLVRLSIKSHGIITPYYDLPSRSGSLESSGTRHIIRLLHCEGYSEGLSNEGSTTDLTIYFLLYHWRPWYVV